MCRPVPRFVKSFSWVKDGKPEHQTDENWRRCTENRILQILGRLHPFGACCFDGCRLSKSFSKQELLIFFSCRSLACFLVMLFILCVRSWLNFFALNRQISCRLIQWASCRAMHSYKTTNLLTCTHSYKPSWSFSFLDSTGAVFAALFFPFSYVICFEVTMQQSMDEAFRSHPANGCWSEPVALGTFFVVGRLFWIPASNCWGMWELTPLKAKLKVS